MKYKDFRIGCEFRTGSGKRWRCTDKGTRVIVAIHVEQYPDDPSWTHGPPYALEEMVFDEYAQEDCVKIESA